LYKIKPKFYSQTLHGGEVSSNVFLVYFWAFFFSFIFLVKIGLVYLIFELKNTQFLKYHQKKMNKENTGLFPLGRANIYIYIYIGSSLLYEFTGV